MCNRGRAWASCDVMIDVTIGWFREDFMALYWDIYAVLMRNWNWFGMGILWKKFLSND